MFPSYLAIADCLLAFTYGSQGITAKSIATHLGVHMFNRGTSQRWYAHVQAACAAGVIVATPGPMCFGNPTTLYTL